MWHHRTIPRQCSLFLIFLVHCNLVVVLSRPGTEVCYFPDLCFSMEWNTFGLPSFISNATFPRGLVPIKNISLGKVCTIHVHVNISFRKIRKIELICSLAAINKFNNKKNLVENGFEINLMVLNSTFIATQIRYSIR